jgi:hypothetical protein
MQKGGGWSEKTELTQIEHRVSAITNIINTAFSVAKAQTLGVANDSIGTQKVQPATSLPNAQVNERPGPT